jgi:hypothetical protein
MRRIVTRPSGANCSRRNSAKLSLAAIVGPSGDTGWRHSVLMTNEKSSTICDLCSQVPACRAASRR